MERVMGQMTLTTEEKMRMAKDFNTFAKENGIPARVSLEPSNRYPLAEVIHDKGQGEPLGSEH
jgi:hypothetical protein